MWCFKEERLQAALGSAAGTGRSRARRRQWVVGENEPRDHPRPELLQEVTAESENASLRRLFSKISICGMDAGRRDRSPPQSALPRVLGSDQQAGRGEHLRRWAL